MHITKDLYPEYSILKIPTNQKEMGKKNLKRETSRKIRRG